MAGRPLHSYIPPLDFCGNGAGDASSAAPTVEARPLAESVRQRKYCQGLRWPGLWRQTGERLGHTRGAVATVQRRGLPATGWEPPEAISVEQKAWQAPAVLPLPHGEPPA